MPTVKPGFLKNPLTYAITAGALGTSAAGIGGYEFGKRRGANKAANIMSDAFSQANQIENAQLANYYFRKGLSQSKNGASMDKQAVLENIYNAAFEDEIEMIAGPNVKKILGAVAGGAKKVWDVTKAVGKAYAGSAKGMAEEAAMGARHIGTALKSHKTRVEKGIYVSRKAAAKDALSRMFQAGRKGGLVLGTGAGVAGGGTTAGVMLANRKKD